MSSLPMNNQKNQSLLHARGTTSSSKAALLLRWWYNLSAPPEVPESASFLTRELVRRGRVASLIILGILCAAILLIPIISLFATVALNLTLVFVSTGTGVICCLLAIAANRLRHVQMAGILLIIAVDVIVAGIVLSEQAGLDPIFLTMFDLLVVSELIAASILNPSSVFGVALINLLLIVLDINFQPRSMMWMQMVMSQTLAYSLLARPVTLYLVVAVVAYLWVRSALKALQRADRAELIAELERREVEQKQQLEREIEHILMTHVRVANGDLNARAPTYQDNVLWQIGIALNNLLSRFRSALLAEQSLQRVTAEISQLRQSLRQWQSGQPLQLYPSTELLINPLVSDLRLALKTAPAQDALSSPKPPNPMQGRQFGQSLPGSVPPMLNPSGQGDMRTNSASPRDKETPLPDNSGFLSHQRLRPQVPELHPYNTLDR